MEKVKLERLQNAIKQEITVILKITANNNLFKNITITNVKVTADYSYATIYWSIYDETVALEVVSEALEKAKGFCRSQLAQTSNAYKVPQLRFKYDETNMRVQKIDDILNSLKSKDDPKNNS